MSTPNFAAVAPRFKPNVVLPQPPQMAMPAPAQPFDAEDPYPLDERAWDLRPDGTKKGHGFLGVLLRPDGRVASEYSIADSERIKDAKGNYLDYPSLVPTLTQQEVQTILTLREGEPVPEAIKRKAEAFALARLKAGKPLFAQAGEENERLHPHIRRAGRKP